MNYVPASWMTVSVTFLVAGPQPSSLLLGTEEWGQDVPACVGGIPTSQVNYLLPVEP